MSTIFSIITIVLNGLELLCTRLQVLRSKVYQPQAGSEFFNLDVLSNYSRFTQLCIQRYGLSMISRYTLSGPRQNATVEPVDDGQISMGNAYPSAFIPETTEAISSTTMPM